jgi:hypothetical protein
MNDTEARADAQETLAHLIIALLSVGGYSIERVWEIRSNLESEGLLDSKAVEMLDEAEVVRRLATSGYDRGPVVTVSMARRLMALHTAVRNGLLAQASSLMQEKRMKDAETLLCTVKGIGPMVFSQFAALLGESKQGHNS